MTRGGQLLGFAFMLLFFSSEGKLQYSAKSFSFPFGGVLKADWSYIEAMHFLRSQVVEFYHNLGELEYSNVFTFYWDYAILVSVIGPPKAEER